MNTQGQPGGGRRGKLIFKILFLLVSLTENSVSHWPLDEGGGEEDGCRGRTGMGCQEERGGIIFRINS